MSDPRRIWMPRERWDALVRGEACPVCAEVTGAGRDNSEGYFVADLRVSRLRLQREQHVPGWCVLLLRCHWARRAGPGRTRVAPARPCAARLRRAWRRELA